MGEQLDLREIWEAGFHGVNFLPEEAAFQVMNMMERFLDNSEAINWDKVPEWAKYKPDDD